jgi:hypothetical protein
LLLYWFFSGPPGVVSPVRGEWTFTSSRCLSAGQVPGRVVPAFTVADFRRLPLPPGKVVVQPGNGRTLVNVPTNVMVQAPQAVLTTTVLGAPVRVRATAVRYRWSFGDGQVLDTVDPGAAFPDLRTTHTYLVRGKASLGLVTSYEGEYSIAGGPWLPVDGVAQVASAPVVLTVVETRAEVVPDPLPAG